MSALTFQRKRVRGGIVLIEIDGRFAGEIATCKWGYALRLPGVYWSPSTGGPARSGWTQKGFRRQKAAIAFVKGMNQVILEKSAAFAAKHNMVMA
jgi:hypothetical protein